MRKVNSNLPIETHCTNRPLLLTRIVSTNINIYIQLNLLINSAGHGNHVLYHPYVNTILPININAVANLQDYRQEHIEDSDLRHRKAKQIH